MLTSNACQSPAVRARSLWLRPPTVLCVGVTLRRLVRFREASEASGIDAPSLRAYARIHLGPLAEVRAERRQARRDHARSASPSGRCRAGSGSRPLINVVAGLEFGVVRLPLGD